MSNTGAGAPARLSWQMGELLPAAVFDRLLGPGTRFEMATEVVLGRELPVFVSRASSLRAMLDRAVADRADDVFMVDGERQWSFADAAAQIDTIAALLVDRYGIEPGDRVGIVSANSPEYALVMWAVVSIGAIVASLNGWWTGPELAFGVQLSEPRLITGDERRLARLADGVVPADVPVVTLADLVAAAELGPDPVGGSPERGPVRSGADGGDLAPEVHEDDPAVILFTSGTTGRPKGATLSHRNIINFGDVALLSAQIGAALAPPANPLTTQPASIVASPMFHVSGMLAVFMSGPVMGTKLVFPPPGRWEEETHLRLTEEHGISAWSGVPTQWWRLLRHPDFDSYDLSSLRNVGGGGAPLAPELIRDLTDRLPGVSVGNGYGMSETVGLGTLTGGALLQAVPDSVGPAQAGGEIEIRDAEGNVLLEGEVGEIHLRNASVFLGYWGDDDATAAALDDDRWYRTGDFGHVTGGMLFLDSRVRDLIIRGGENIYPLEIEHRLVAHPDIDDAAVIGVDHEELGQQAKAFVVVRAGADLTAPDVQRWVAEALAAFKVPALVEFRDALPYTDSGKVLKRELGG